MSPRTGRPKAENPKDIQLKIRADKQTIHDLDYCCEKLEKTRSDIIRLGIQKVKTEVETKYGNTLGQLLNIDYNWGELNVFSRTSYDIEDCIQPLMAMSKCAAPEIEPDDINVSDTVAFTWEIT